MLPHLSYEDCVQLGVTTADVVKSIEELILARAENKMWNAPKAVIQPPDGRYMMAALAACTDPPLLRSNLSCSTRAIPTRVSRSSTVWSRC